MNLRAYMVGSVIVHTAMIVASAVLLAGTDYLAQILPILGASAFWSIVIAPAAFRVPEPR